MPRFTPLPLAASLLTAPVGVNPFAKARISKTTFEETSVAVLTLLILYLLVTFLPDLSYAPMR